MTPLNQAYGAHEYWNAECEDKWMWLVGIHVVSWIAQFVGNTHILIYVNDFIRPCNSLQLPSIPFASKIIIFRIYEMWPTV